MLIIEQLCKLRSTTWKLHEKGTEAIWSKNMRKEEKLNTEYIDKSQFKGKCNMARDETTWDILNRPEERCPAWGNKVMKILYSIKIRGNRKIGRLWYLNSKRKQAANMKILTDAKLNHNRPRKYQSILLSLYTNLSPKWCPQIDWAIIHLKKSVVSEEILQNYYYSSF